MTILKARKEVAALPSLLEANTIYVIRTGMGFDLYITDNTGSIAHKLNGCATALTSPVFSYTNGVLTGITYTDGSFKTFTYINGKIATIDLTRGLAKTRKTFVYTGDILSSIVETIL